MIRAKPNFRAASWPERKRESITTRSGLIASSVLSTSRVMLMYCDGVYGECAYGVFLTILRTPKKVGRCCSRAVTSDIFISSCQEL